LGFGVWGVGSDEGVGEVVEKVVRDGLGGGEVGEERCGVGFGVDVDLAKQPQVERSGKRLGEGVVGVVGEGVQEVRPVAMMCPAFSGQLLNG